MASFGDGRRPAYWSVSGPDVLLYDGHGAVLTRRPVEGCQEIVNSFPAFGQWLSLQGNSTVRNPLTGKLETASSIYKDPVSGTPFDALDLLDAQVREVTDWGADPSLERLHQQTRDLALDA